MGRPARVVNARRVSDEGYVLIYLPPSERPPGAVKSHFPEHRIVMSKVIGRHLWRDESVHHKNGDRQDNRPENLELWVNHQPRGQRVSDLLAFARYVLAEYGHLE